MHVYSSIYVHLHLSCFMLSLWIQFVLSSSLLSDSWTGPLSSNATSAIVKAGIGSSSSNKAVSATENTTIPILWSK